MQYPADSGQTGHFMRRCKTLMYAFGRQKSRGLGVQEGHARRTRVLLFREVLSLPGALGREDVLGHIIEAATRPTLTLTAVRSRMTTGLDYRIPALPACGFRPGFFLCEKEKSVTAGKITSGPEIASKLYIRLLDNYPIIGSLTDNLLLRQKFFCHAFFLEWDRFCFLHYLYDFHDKINAASSEMILFGKIEKSMITFWSIGPISVRLTMGIRSQQNGYWGNLFLLKYRLFFNSA
jgi:hypothetical protein